MSFNSFELSPPVVSDPFVLNADGRVGGTVIVAGGGGRSATLAFSTCSTIVLYAEMRSSVVF